MTLPQKPDYLTYIHSLSDEAFSISQLPARRKMSSTTSYPSGTQDAPHTSSVAVPYVFLDHNATSPLRHQARTAMMAAWETLGNPSSTHQAGQRARMHLERARLMLAQTLEVNPTYITFTSGGTEANNLALGGASSLVKAIFISASEHPSVLFAHQDAVRIPLESNGRLHLPALENLLKAVDGPALVSVALANYETGILENISEVANLVHRYDGFLHTDCVQAFGRIPFTFEGLKADLMSISSHKIGGPCGIGALIVSSRVPLKPIMHGGGQEKGLRPGTVSVPLAVGFSMAAQEATASLDSWKHNKSWHQNLEERMLYAFPKAYIVGKKEERLPNTTCISIPGVSAESQVIFLDLQGIAVSTGSACASGKVSASPVLRAMGLEDIIIEGAIRISSGWNTKSEDMDILANAWHSFLQRRIFS